MVILLDKISKAREYAKRHGWRPMLLVALVQLRSASKSNISVVAKYDSFIAPCFGRNIQNQELDKKTINWFIPPVGKGSGGHLNIFRFLRNLEYLGYRNRIVIVGDPQPKSAEVAKQNIHDWFFPLKADIYIDDGSEIPPAFFAMATEWRTAYFVKRFLSCMRKCYFVQDFEPWFFPVGTDFIFAENTYSFGFYGFTAGTWLAKKLAEDYGMRTFPLGFSYDRNLYSPNSSEAGIPMKMETQRVFFYARPPTARRAFELGILVLREVTRKMPNVSIILAGWDMCSYKIPFKYENAGLVELDKLGGLYRRCDVALVLSFTNVSLLPIELMACGVPVVSNRAPYTEWLLDNCNSVLAGPTIELLSQAIISVLMDGNISKYLKESGLKFAQKTSWESEAMSFAEELERIANEEYGALLEQE
jgi:glycosyltransferase involved in cell wall biosynthesis